MDRLLQDLRHAARMLRKTPVFTAVVILTLALGIGANTAMFSVVNAVLLQGLPFPDAGRVVDFTETNNRERGGGAIAPANFLDYRQQATSFTAMAAWQQRSFNLAPTGGEPERVPGVMVSTTFFEVLGVEPSLGRTFTPQDAEPGRATSMVLSYALWQRRFAGAADVINRTVRVDGRPYTVIGVMPPTVTFPQQAQFWLSSEHDLPSLPGGPDPRENRGMHYLRGVARLKPQVTLAAANAELDTIGKNLARQYPDVNASFVGVVTSLHEQLAGSARTPLLVLLGAVACVLLIVVANVANLLMSRATVRARELAIRAAVGATRDTLVRQLLTESVLLSVVGGALGVLLAFWGVDLILALDPGEVPRVTPIRVDLSALAFAFGLSVLTGLLFGVVPAIQASRPDLQGTLKEATRGSTGDGVRQYARGALVLVEVALCLVLLVGAGLLFRSLMTLLDVPLGATTSNVLSVQVSPAGEDYREPGQALGYWDRALERVRALPGIESAALTDSPPMGRSMAILTFAVQGRPELPPSQSPLSHLLTVSPDYFRTLGIPVLRGREFEGRDVVERPRAVVINQAMARREFADRDPIGQRISFGPDDAGEQDWLEIVGVVGNVRQYRLDEEPVPMTYVPHSSSPNRAYFVLVRTAGRPTAAAASVRAALQALDPALPVAQARTLDEVIGASLTQRRFNMTLLAVFAGIALVLALAGIYGMVTFAVAQRTQEIGIRVALGASGGEVLRLVMWDALKPVAGGLVLGLVGAFVVTRLLGGLVWGVSTTDPVTFAGLAALLALVAGLASLVPALRATRVDPMIALRVE
jgi:putative ABC transport system permease protein